MHLTFKTKKNGCEFLTLYIRPRSAVDSVQWDWGIRERQDDEIKIKAVIRIPYILNLSEGPK